MKLEDRIRATLHAEAERFEPHLAPTNLRPEPESRAWLAFTKAAAAVVILVGTGVLLVRPVPPTDTVPPPVTTEPVVTSTTAGNPSSTPPTFPNQLTPWVPEYSVENGLALLVLEFIDGSTAEIRWLESLDLMSGGVYPYGYAHIPQVAARDFFIRRGDVEDVVKQFGPATVLDEYSDGRGGTVALWHPEGAGVDFLGFQFGDWAVLVYEGGSEVLTPTMSIRNRQRWAESFRGETTDGGFLRLYGDEPLRLANDKQSMTLQSPMGSVELHLGECPPSEPSESPGDFVSWCDQGGLIDVHVTGPNEFARAVYEGLQIGTVHPKGVFGPDANGSYGYLQDELERAAEVWAAKREELEVQTGEEPAYRLTLTGHLGFMSFDFAVVVRNGVAQLESGQPWPDPLPTVETIFGLVDAGIERGEQVTARFHPDGHVTWLARSVPRGLLGEGLVLSVQLEWLD